MLLEKKAKVDGMCRKRKIRLTREEGARLARGDGAFLLRRPEELAHELYAKMRGRLLAPRTVVTYEREAFAWHPGNVRVTLDGRLRAGTHPAGFLDARRATVPVDPGFVVLEVKYDAFLPDAVRAAVQVFGRRHAAYSKYALCRRFE